MGYSFFIRRPVLSAVISIIIIMAGFICLRLLPISQYPELQAPTVSVSAIYPGASAQTVAQTVAFHYVRRLAPWFANQQYVSSDV